MSDEIIVDGESVTVIEITTGQIGPVGPEGPQGDPGVVDYTGLVLDDDSRLTDSRTPLSHTHPQSDITNLTTDLGNKADLVDGVVPTAQIPSLAINDTFVVANQSAMLALTAETGDIAIRSDLSKTFVLQASPASTLSNWVELSTPTDVITSVNGQTGSVVLGYSDVGAAPTSHTHANTDITGLGTAALVDTGTGATNVILGNDARLTDARTPNAHAASHVSAGSDPLTIDQSQVTDLTTDLSSKVEKTTLNANSVLYAVTDDTPAALAVGASTVVGRKATGDVVAMTATEAKNVLAITNTDVSGLGTAAVTNTGTGATNTILGNDARLTDARTPIAHTHPQSDITNLTTDLGNKADLVEGIIPTSQIPSLAINDTFVAANQAAMLALTAQVGDIAIRSDINRTFVLQTAPASTLANWIMLSGGSDVVSVNGQTGIITLGYSDVGADVAGAAASAQSAAQSYAAALVDDLSGVTNASAARTALGLGTAAVANTGTGAANVILGNDARLTDTRTPSAASIVDAMIATTLSQSKIANLTTDLAAKAPLTLTLNQQVASYSLVLADAGKLVEISNGSANTLTVPLNSSQAFPVGTQINFVQTGAGQTTITPDSGVTINGTPTLKLRAQWSSVTLIKRATDTWLAIGDLAAS